MAEVTLDAVPQKARDLFNKGLGAYERGRLDHAIDLLTHALDIEPRLLEARKILRVAEVKRFNTECGGRIARVKALLTALPSYVTAIVLLRRGKAAEALAASDRVLKIYPLEKRFMFLFAEAAEKAGLPEAAIQMLEIGQSQFPGDPDVMEHLGKGFLVAGDTRKATVCFERLCELRPNDAKALKFLKDAMALGSIGADAWGSQSGAEGSFRGLIRDQDEAKLLEQQAKAVKTDGDLNDLIADMRKKIEAEPANVNYRRNLARFYVQLKLFDEALTALKDALTMAPGDPEVENAISEIAVQKFDAEIAQFKEAGRGDDARAKETARDQFVFDDLQDRVARYPNDLTLRYRLGVLLFENDYTDEAIQQFQLSQRNAQHRAKSLYYLGRCFRSKKQYDLASEQLEAAAAEFPRVDGLKKDILYELGEVAELVGDRQKAAQYFKQIYQADIRFRDVSDKMERVYSR